MGCMVDDKKMVAAFYKLRKDAAKIARKGVNAGLTPMAQAVRAAVSAAPLSDELKAAARKSVGKRMVKGTDPPEGKIGFGVGKQTARKKEQIHTRTQRGPGGSGEKRGVGVSANNIHWFVLGTQDRTTTAGHPTGKIAGLLSGIVQSATSGNADAVMAAARANVDTALRQWASQNRT